MKNLWEQNNVMFLNFNILIQAQEFHESWQILKEEGILRGKLIQYVWRRFKPEEQNQLLTIMKQFDLICDAPKEEEEEEGKPNEGDVTCEETVMHPDSSCYNKNFYVPSMFSPENVKDLDDSKPTIFYADGKERFTSK